MGLNVNDNKLRFPYFKIVSLFITNMERQWELPLITAWISALITRMTKKSSNCKCFQITCTRLQMPWGRERIYFPCLNTLFNQKIKSNCVAWSRLSFQTSWQSARDKPCLHSEDAFQFMIHEVSLPQFCSNFLQFGCIFVLPQHCLERIGGPEPGKE